MNDLLFLPSECHFHVVGTLGSYSGLGGVRLKVTARKPAFMLEVFPCFPQDIQADTITET
jgi:hypothetical protein